MTWSARDELIYWLQFVGMGALLVVVSILRFAFAVAFRVLDLALALVAVVAVLALVAWAVRVV